MTEESTGDEVVQGKVEDIKETVVHAFEGDTWAHAHQKMRRFWFKKDKLDGGHAEVNIYEGSSAADTKVWTRAISHGAEGEYKPQSVGPHFVHILTDRAPNEFKVEYEWSA